MSKYNVSKVVDLHIYIYIYIQRIAKYAIFDMYDGYFDSKNVICHILNFNKLYLQYMYIDIL